jgi:hypothetical protein
LQEPAVLELDDGRLICVMRRRASQAFSYNGGRSWSKPAPLPYRADCPYLLQTATGLLLCAHRYRGTSVSISADRATTWSDPISIDTGPGAYPSMVELDDGRILCLYYKEAKGRSTIWQAVFRVAPEGHLEFEEP